MNLSDNESVARESMPIAIFVSEPFVSAQEFKTANWLMAIAGLSVVSDIQRAFRRQVSC